MARGKRAARGRRAAAVLRQNAIPFLFQLAKETEWKPPTKVVRSFGGDPKYATTLAKRLAAAGVVDLKPAGKVADKPTYLVAINTRGRELISLMEPVVQFLEPTDPPPRKGSSRDGKQ